MLSLGLVARQISFLYAGVSSLGRYSHVPSVVVSHLQHWWDRMYDLGTLLTLHGFMTVLECRQRNCLIALQACEFQSGGLSGRWYADTPLQDGVFVDIDTLPGGSLSDFNLGNTAVQAQPTALASVIRGVCELEISLSYLPTRTLCT